MLSKDKWSKKKLMGIVLTLVVFLGLSSAVSATTVTFLKEQGGESAGTMNIVGRALNSAQNISVQEPTKLGYSFNGWSTGDSFVTLNNNNNTIRINMAWYTNQYGFRLYGYPDAATVYGTWTENQYTISYDLDGGTEPDPANPVTYTVNDEVSITDPTKEGYTFIGWLDEQGTDLWIGYVIQQGSTGDKRLLAVWEKNSEQTTEETPKTTTPTTTSNPKTGISTTADIVILIIGLISFIGLVIYNPKKNNN